MPWIKVEAALPRHRKIGYLARALGISKPTAIGHLICLWTSVMELVENGDITKWNENDVSDYANWTGDPQAFYKALVNEGDGWIDERKGHKYIHDWDTYAYNYINSRYHSSCPDKVREMKERFKKPKGHLQVDEKRGEEIRIHNTTALGWFDQLWAKYPKRIGKKGALRFFLASVKTEESFSLITKALENYSRSREVAKGFVKNAETWFNNWEDWVDYKNPEKEEQGVWAR